MSLPTWQPAASADEPALLTLMAAFYAEDHLLFRPEVARAALATLFAQPALGGIFLLRAAPTTPPEGYLVLTTGFSLEFHGRFVLLDEVYLAPALRGQGLGRQALDFAAAWTRAQGAVALRLEVNRANTHARTVYLRAGFHDDRRDLLTRWV